MSGRGAIAGNRPVPGTMMARGGSSKQGRGSGVACKFVENFQDCRYVPGRPAVEPLQAIDPVEVVRVVGPIPELLDDRGPGGGCVGVMIGGEGEEQGRAELVDEGGRLGESSGPKPPGPGDR
jgi:hypothetical protein